MKPSVVGLVLNYNGRDVTLETLRSLLALEYPNLHLVVVDNGSTDGSFEAIREAFPQVEQVRVRENRGISWGLDHGIQHALERGCDYVLLMNNDIEVDPAMLGELVAAAEADPRAGCAGPKSYYFAERRRLWSTGGILRWRGDSVTRERGDGELDAGQYDRDEEVDYVNGCAMLVRREAVERTGFWDPVYYLGVEDADFCVRMKREGFRCLYVHRARLWHRISHSIGVYRPSRTYHTGRSTAIFLRKYATPWQWTTAVATLLAAIPLAALRELPRGNQGAALQKLRGFVAGLRVELPEIPRSFDELVATEEA
ncbi:MAG TPA: glycosyltransferase family 2 protein [Thermoanaerobaculia bacterium]|nr:glycosyltransferase family 2 protein [Thermoanaerobaculia bacterium]